MSDRLPPPRRRRRFLSHLLFLIAGGLVTGTFFYLQRQSVPVVAPPRTEKPFRTTIEKTVRANGTILPKKEVEIKPQISGIISELLVQPGALVRLGDPLARIRPITDPVEINAAESRLRRAELQARLAERRLERARQLLTKEFIPESEFEDLELQRDLTRQEQAEARVNLDLLLTGVSSENLERTATIAHATVDGTVLETQVEEGDFVVETNPFNPGTTILVLADMADLMFRGRLEETSLAGIQVGTPMEIRVGALPGLQLGAAVNFLAPKGVETEGVTRFEIRADLRPPPGVDLRAGYSSTGTIVLERRENVLAIRERLIRFEGGRPFVDLVRDEGNPEKRFLKLGISNSLEVEVLEGLQGGETLRVPET